MELLEIEINSSNPMVLLLLWRNLAVHNLETIGGVIEMGMRLTYALSASAEDFTSYMDYTYIFILITLSKSTS